jgi:hypothetical protein
MSPLRGGLPHSEISGSPGARPSPELFAACHVLHRLSVPRHPPDALVVLAHAQPQGRAGRASRAARCQRSDVRCQTASGRPGPMPLHPASHFRPLSRSRCVSIAPTGATRPGVAAYPCPGTTERPHATRGSRRPLLSCPLHGHDSLHDVKTAHGHTCLSRGGVSRSRLRAAPQGACWSTPAARTHAWWAWADLNGRPHAYQACALAS